MKPAVFIKLILLFMFMMAPELSARCAKPILEKIVSEHDHIFVGFVTDAYFSEEDDLECGVAIGNIELVEKPLRGIKLAEPRKSHGQLIPFVTHYKLAEN